MRRLCCTGAGQCGREARPGIACEPVAIFCGGGPPASFGSDRAAPFRLVLFHPWRLFRTVCNPPANCSPVPERTHSALTSKGQSLSPANRSPFAETVLSFAANKSSPIFRRGRRQFPLSWRYPGIGCVPTLDAHPHSQRGMRSCEPMGYVAWLCENRGVVPNCPFATAKLQALLIGLEKPPRLGLRLRPWPRLRTPARRCNRARCLHVPAINLVSNQWRESRGRFTVLDQI